jgi:hypothetical protein
VLATGGLAGRSAGVMSTAADQPNCLSREASGPNAEEGCNRGSVSIRDTQMGWCSKVLLCFLSCTSKKGSRPPGRIPGADSQARKTPKNDPKKSHKEPKLDNALSMCSMFSLKKDEAAEEVVRVAKVVAQWKRHFAACGVSRGDIEFHAEQIDRPFLKQQRDIFKAVPL